MLERFSGSVVAVAILSAVVFAGARPGAMGQSHGGRPGTSGAASQNLAALQKKADEARDAGQLDDAVKLYHRALAVNPK